MRKANASSPKRKLDNGYELSFYAKGETSTDFSLLAHCIDVFSHLMLGWDSYIRLICKDLDEKCSDYFNGASASDILGQETLELVSIDVESIDLATVTLYDTSQTLGGHYVVADLNGS